MSSSAETSDGEHEVELIADEIASLLTQPEKPKINIFTFSYPRGTSEDQVRKPLETETSSSIPLLEAAFTRCTIILVLSFVWLRKCGQSSSHLLLQVTALNKPLAASSSSEVLLLYLSGLALVKEIRLCSYY
ncbi:unnamed protein product [Malus baccata var. baccata]